MSREWCSDTQTSAHLYNGVCALHDSLGDDLDQLLIHAVLQWNGAAPRCMDAAMQHVEDAGGCGVAPYDDIAHQGSMNVQWVCHLHKEFSDSLSTPVIAAQSEEILQRQRHSQHVLQDSQDAADHVIPGQPRCSSSSERELLAPAE